MRQHLESPEKQHLSSIRVILDETFNKSVCLDLESYLIRLLAGDGTFRVLNRNDGITEADYFERERYRESFRDVFEQLRADGVFTRSIPEIENSDLFKLSPFKALTQDQAVAVEGIVEGLLEDLESELEARSSSRARPGTGKTVDRDLPAQAAHGHRALEPRRHRRQRLDVRGVLRRGEPASYWRISASDSSSRSSRCGSPSRGCSRRRPGLRADMVVTPFEVGKSDEMYDVLIVDEAHRLNQRANQPSGPTEQDVQRDHDEALRVRRSHQDAARLDSREESPPALPARRRAERSTCGRAARALDELVVDARERSALLSARVSDASAGGGGLRLVRPPHPRSGSFHWAHRAGDVRGLRLPLVRQPRCDARRDSPPRCRGWTCSTGRRLRVGVEDEERQDCVGHRARWPSAPLERDAGRLDRLAGLGARGRIDPHRAGLRPQLRGRDHRRGPPVRTRPRDSSSIEIRTSTRRARRTIRSSGSCTPTTIFCDSSRTSTRCC